MHESAPGVEPVLRSRQTLITPIAVGTIAITCTVAALVATNVVFTRHYLLVSETSGVPELSAGYWVLLGAVDLALAATIAALVVFVVSNARQVLLMRRQDTFIDGVTHELKSPLASLRLALDTVTRHNLEDDQRDHFMRTMRGDVDRLQRFIEQLLEAGRLQHRERSFELEACSARDLVLRCIEQIASRHSLENQAIELVADERDDMTVITDHVALEIAVLNLLDNAVKYSAGAPRVTVTLAVETRRIVIRVADHGVGIARRELGRVFNRFYRVTSVDRASTRGTGLGLFVSRGLVRRLGGDIHAMSDGVGEGSAFTITLPRRAPST